MQLIKATISGNILDGSIKIRSRRLPKRVVFPLVIVIVLVAGLLSPLFNLNHIHGFPGMHAYGQHLYFDAIADAGGFYASTFCKHWYHRLPIAVGFALVSTLALVTLVG
jgi:hypothetical protein